MRWVSELARVHSRGLAALARKEGLPAEDALDAVQEAFQTFLLLPQARSLVEEPRDSASVLAALVRNAARNMRRRHHRALPHAPLEDEPDLEADDVSVDEAIERAEEHVRLLGCVNRLAEMQRVLVYVDLHDAGPLNDFARQLIESGRERAAWAAPLRPEIHENGLGRAKHLLLELLSTVDALRLVLRHARLRFVRGFGAAPRASFIQVSRAGGISARDEAGRNPRAARDL